MKIELHATNLENNQVLTVAVPEITQEQIASFVQTLHRQLDEFAKKYAIN